MGTRDHENSTLAFLTQETTMSPDMELRERIKIEFYKTYDVMTGIRIAATLGGFFSMMILLVLYKNYCKPSKTISEEQLNAAVTAAVEEEDRALQAALEATSFYTSLEKRRQSLENTNQLLLSPRFSSVGGGYSHLAPPLKMTVMQQRGKSLPGSVMQFGSSGSPFCFQKSGKLGRLSKEEDFKLESQLPDFFACRSHLNVPFSRRVSSVTCSSADSSYLERRCSAFEVGLPGLPHYNKQSREKLLGKKEEQWDFYYPIDIQVIQPTPEMSPTASERNLHNDQKIFGLQVPGFNDQMHRLSVTSFDMGLAPLASISSLGSFSNQSTCFTSKSLNAGNNNNSGAENQGSTCGDDSVGSDSVFMDDMNVEDGVDEFATDSEFEYDGFDDDYSFCESKQRPISRTEMRPFQFASFDSYDASITQDSVSENIDPEISSKAGPSENIKPTVQAFRQPSHILKRHPSLNEENKAKRKLVKTYSEPRNSKFVKHLPIWLEKGKSGYIPKRQLSTPSSKKNYTSEVIKKDKFSLNLNESKNQLSFEKGSEESKYGFYQEDENAKDLSKFLLPSSPCSSSSDVSILAPSTKKLDETSTFTQKQGHNNNLPLNSTHQLSLSNMQEKRNRLQKQKNFIEEVKPTSQIKEKTEVEILTGSEESICSPAISGGFLKPPNILLSGSCERLTSSPSTEGTEKVPADRIKLSFCQDDQLFFSDSLQDSTL